MKFDGYCLRLDIRSCGYEEFVLVHWCLVPSEGVSGGIYAGKRSQLWSLHLGGDVKGSTWCVAAMSGCPLVHMALTCALANLNDCDVRVLFDPVPNPVTFTF